MLCYKDMTFCSRSEDCQNKECSHNFNEEREAGAFAWMGENAPVCWGDMKTPNCGYKE